MNILIITEPDDVHAVLVKLALEAKGANCTLFFSADMPSKQKNTISISTEHYAWNSSDSTMQMLHTATYYDAIWWRRPRNPYIPDYIHQEDTSFVQKENAIFHSSIPHLFDDATWWVNPIASHQKTKSKIIQLKLAQECGFNLPTTLISNSPEEIKAFINTYSGQPVIYKPFLPQFWHEKEQIKILYTNIITLKDLPSDAMLQAVPGIYQHYVAKQYEVRVTCFGNCISAIKIDSQKNCSGQTDWRKIPSQQLMLSEIDLPQDIKNKIILYMKKIGVVFGCFDFIVTPDNEVIFLELNEQGQFLWIEELLPEVCYLDMFAEFIMAKRFYFNWTQNSDSLQAAQLDAKAIKIVEANVKNHVYLNQLKRVA